MHNYSMVTYDTYKNRKELANLFQRIRYKYTFQ